MDRVAMPVDRFICAAIHGSSVRHRDTVRPERSAAGAKSKGTTRSGAA